MMQSNSAVPYWVVKYVALFAISIAGCQPRNVPGEHPKLPGGYTETITSKSGKKISFEMVPVPGGTFVMGSPQNEPGSKDDERPRHKVRLAPFYLCTTETTIELFLEYYQETMSTKKSAGRSRDDVDAITGPTPVYGDLTMGYGKKHPAVGMTWHNASTFCRWLSKKTGREYRLPTEAEWEYACRAGATNIFGFGNDPKRLAEFAWYEANSDGEPHEVAGKKPNALGLYDMSGNVCEWVNDFYSPDAYRNAAKESPTVNPQGPTDGSSRGAFYRNVHVARGGDYSGSADELRCAARFFEETWWRDGDPQMPKSKWWLPQMDLIGFRIASSIDPTSSAQGNQDK
jgi:formylglycine-generating enzyme required for sulfatase activity